MPTLPLATEVHAELDILESPAFLFGCTAEVCWGVALDVGTSDARCQCPNGYAGGGAWDAAEQVPAEVQRTLCMGVKLGILTRLELFCRTPCAL